MPFQDWQQRVIEERVELDKKRAALEAFINAETFQDFLDFDIQCLMINQCLVMKHYSEILQKRIEKFRS